MTIYIVLCYTFVAPNSYYFPHTRFIVYCFFNKISYYVKTCYIRCRKIFRFPSSYFERENQVVRLLQNQFVIGTKHFVQKYLGSMYTMTSNISNHDNRNTIGIYILIHSISFTQILVIILNGIYLASNDVRKLISLQYFRYNLYFLIKLFMSSREHLFPKRLFLLLFRYC